MSINVGGGANIGVAELLLDGHGVIGGVAVGGILGAPMSIAQMVQSYRIATQVGQQYIDGADGKSLEQAFQMGMRNIPGSDARNVAEKAVRMYARREGKITPYAIGRMVLESQAPQAVRQQQIAAITVQTAQDMGVDIKTFAEPVAVAAARAGIPVEFVSEATLAPQRVGNIPGSPTGMNPPDSPTVSHPPLGKGGDAGNVPRAGLQSTAGGSLPPSSAASAATSPQANVDHPSLVRGGQVETVPSGQYAVETEAEAMPQKVVDLSTDNELSARVGDLKGAKKFKVIQEYVFETLGGKEISLSDGKIAVVDNSDAKHIASNAADKKTAQISKIKELIETAQLCAEDKNVQHNKFDYFCYYEAFVKYDGDVLPAYINVGKAKNDGTYHIYDITQNLRDTADRMNGLGRPKPNEGYALRNGVSMDSISENGENVNSKSQAPAAVMEGTGKDGTIFFGAMYDRENGRILINADAINDGRITVGQTLDFFLKHELTHKIEKAGVWNKLATIARREMGAEAFDAQVQAVQERRAADGDTVGGTPEGAKKEVVADWVGTNLFRKEFAKVMAKEYKGFANNLVLTFSGLRRGLAATEKGRQAARMKYAEQLYLKALAESAPDVTDEQIAAHLEEVLNRMAEDGQPTAENGESLPPSSAASADATPLVRGGQEKTVQTGQYAIVELENGKKYVKADTQVISGTDTTKWASQVSGYINRVLRNGNDLSITADNGDVLTLTKDTAYKAGTRNKIKNPDGTYRDMTDAEYSAKLNAEVHIHELAEVSRSDNKNPRPDTKKHRFAKDGFVYRTAFFEDFDGQYYRVTISVGLNGNVSTIYNVGRIEKDTVPYSKIKRVYSGSTANTVSNTTVPQNADGVKNKSMQNGGENSPIAGQRAQMTPEIAAQLRKNQAEIDERNRRRGIQKADAQAELDAVVDNDVDSDTDADADLDEMLAGDYFGTEYVDGEAAIDSLLEQFAAGDITQQQLAAAVAQRNQEAYEQGKQAAHQELDETYEMRTQVAEEWYGEAYDKEREREKRYWNNRRAERESQENTRNRHMLYKEAGRFFRTLTDPKKEKHLPPEMVGPATELSGAIMAAANEDAMGRLDKLRAKRENATDLGEIKQLDKQIENLTRALQKRSTIKTITK